jgi:5-carboxymethyl-2-hydroxymuconate isomerase
MLNFCGIVVAILKMETDRNFSMSGINSGHHNLPTYEISLKSNNVEFVRFCGGHLKMVTGRNFSMSGINSGHHNLHTYEMSLKSDNVAFVQHWGGHFENGDRYKFFNAGNQFGTSLSTHISNFYDIGQC